MPYAHVLLQENLHSWLADKLGRDQFAVRHGDNTVVCFNDGKRGRADVAFQREYWTESFVQWSPQARGGKGATLGSRTRAGSRAGRYLRLHSWPRA